LKTDVELLLARIVAVLLRTPEHIIMYSLFIFNVIEKIMENANKDYEPVIATCTAIVKMNNDGLEKKQKV
jgi:flagellar biosynthesis regulator FlaF